MPLSRCLGSFFENRSSKVRLRDGEGLRGIGSLSGNQWGVGLESPFENDLYHVLVSIEI